MSDPNAQEPTMEEILASIRRIISEDEPTPAAEAEAAAPPQGDPLAEEADDDILELTDRVEPAAEPPAPAPADDDEASSFESSGDLDIYAPPPSRPEPRSQPQPTASFDSFAEDEPLVSNPTADTASSAFGQLARTVTMPAQGRVLEDVVRELLRPMLKDWLDKNLPDIVEAAVQAEVERIARRRLS